MAIVIGSPIGNLSGKLGGLVFSRVAGRSTVRGFTKPVQPNSQAQITARASFGSASQTYHALTDTLKANWSSYAKTIFNAKDQIQQGQWSGFNAFVSLRNLVNMAGYRALTPNYTNSADEALDGTTVAFANSANPPSDQLQANVATLVTGAPCAMTLSSIVLADNGEFDIAIDFVNCPVTGLGQSDFEDGVGNAFGFAIYVSEVINQEHNFVVNPSNQLLGIMPGLSGGTKSLATATGIHVINETDLNVAKYKSFGQVDDIVQLSVYSVSENGMIACIGSGKVTITAA